jgi:predicted AlkP superfamily pyrophosphatase or phosphodiesterase
MKSFLFIYLTFSFAFSLLISCANGNKKAGGNYTIIVSLDGFRWDYPMLHGTPNLDEMSRRGVSAVMRPSYPSSTFPNHYTMVTGLVPDHHGIINNSFRDVKNNRQYSIGDSLARYNPDYYKGEPIWITAQRQGVVAGSLYWVGSDVKIKGELPAYYKAWNDEPRLSFAERIDTALAWLNKPETERPRLITLYIDEPDGAGHRAGPHGDETRQTVRMLDSLTGTLMKGIEALPFGERINLIVTSDHGMTGIAPERFVNISDYLKPEWYEHIVGSNPSSIYCSASCCDSIRSALSGAEGVRVYGKDEVPPSLSYGTNENAGNMIAIADCGWQFGFRPLSQHGAHGYDPSCSDMHVIFFAYGPDFKRNYRAATFDNTALYPLLAILLGVEPAPNDGKAPCEMMNVE